MAGQKIPTVNQRHFVESRRVVSDAPFSLHLYFLLLLPPSWLARSPYMDLLVSWKHTNRWGRWRGLPSILGLHLTPLPPTCHWRSSLRLYKHTWLNIQKRFLNWIFFLSLVFFPFHLTKNESSFLMAHDSSIRRIAADEIKLEGGKIAQLLALIKNQAKSGVNVHFLSLTTYRVIPLPRKKKKLQTRGSLSRSFVSHYFGRWALHR